MLKHAKKTDLQIIWFMKQWLHKQC